MRPLAAGDSPKQPACCGESVGKGGRWTAAPHPGLRPVPARDRPTPV